MCQLAPQVGALADNRAVAAEAVVAGAAAGAGIVVLPELVSSGYVFADVAEARSCAEPADGPTLEGWRELTRKLSVLLVAGFCELGADGKLYNSAALIEKGEVRAVYRKAHLWDSEKLFFTPGDKPPPVVGTEFGRVAMMICYDLEFPEWPRAAGRAGADLAAVPVNWPDEGRPAGERPVEVIRAQAAACANRMFVAVADRCGAERGVSWVGGSVLVGPDGFPLAGPIAVDESGMLFADVDLASARDKAISPRNHVFEDRRLDLYPDPLDAGLT